MSGSFKRIILCVLVFAMLMSTEAFAFELHDWAVSEFELARGVGLVTENAYLLEYDSDITRVRFCELAVRLYDSLAEKKSRSSSEHPFEDTQNSSVNKAYGLGIVSGISESEFGPYLNITREQIALMLQNLLKALDLPINVSASVVLAALADEHEISGWARPAVELMLKSGHMKGVSEDRFAPKDNVTVEQAVILSYRIFDAFGGALPGAEPVITSHADGDFVPYESLEVSWEGADTDDCEIYLIKRTDRKSVSFSKETKSKTYSIPASEIEKLDEGYLAVRAGNVFSKPVHVYFGERNIRIKNKSAIASTTGEPYLSLEWVGVEEAYDYFLEIKEQRVNEAERIPDGATALERTWGATSFSMRTYHPRRYTITVYAVDESLERLGFSDSVTVSNRSPRYSGSLTSIDEIVSKETADARMSSIKINVWRIGAGGQKVASTAWVTVNYELADVFAKVFEEIFNGPEQFPIKSVGGYAWRAPMASGRLSEHNYGTAVDINPDENYCIYSNGTVVGSHWKPYEDPYSITPYGDVAKAFEENGFTWGGDAWSGTIDYMHFSYMGT